MGLLERLSAWHADRRIRKLIRRAPARTLTDLSEDAFARVVGTIQLHRTRALEAPLSGRLCAYYSITVHGRPRPAPAVPRPPGLTRQRPGFYGTIAEEHEGIPFELEVDGVRAVVDPEDAWISSGFDHNEAGVASLRARALVLRLALDPVTYDQDGFRFQEAVLGIGERIAVFGAGVREPCDAVVEQGYRDVGLTRFRFTGTPRFPLVIRDDLQSL